VNHKHEDTIAAICTGVGGSIAIIRLSGPDADAVAAAVWHSGNRFTEIPPRAMVLGRVINGDGQTEDQGLVVRMPAPNSYTGENVVEFHCHGGVTVARTVLSLMLNNGARHADPGEFTKRAFLNGRIDLTQAEAVLDVIQAQSRMALHAANRQLQGVLANRVDVAYETLRAVLAEIEVRMDFVDEDLDWDPKAAILDNLESARGEVVALLRYREAGEVLHHGIRMVIAGAPNAGKSSLLNLILGRDRAIVTDVPGTTRDTLEEPAHIRGIPVKIVDTAGIRESSDIVEQHGVERSRDSIRQAQLVLWVVDTTAEFAEQQAAITFEQDGGLIIVANKIDVAPVTFADHVEAPIVEVSAVTGTGLDALYDAVERAVWQRPHTEEPEIAINSRHVTLLQSANDHLLDAVRMCETDDFELIATDIRAALDGLGRITGRTMQPDILDNIFSKFCIGK
jgi:tRNA modification GTPase